MHLAAAAAAAAAPLLPRTAAAAQEAAPANTLRFFPGFTAKRVKTSGAEIHLVHAGSGPPLLLMHGAPQTHVSMRLIARQLARDYTVIVPDLRGYGDSSKPPDGDNHANYSKRAMALDQVEVMKSFGFDRFAVVGHDRGGRVGHRMALDHPDKVTRLAVLDIVPTHYLYTHVTIQFVQAYFHWFNYLRAAPAPENDLKAQYEAQQARATSEVQIEYLRTSSDPANIHAMCEDYRAGASIDLQHDEADLAAKVQCPLMTLWGLKGPMGRIFDVLAIWKTKGVNVTGKGLGGGHNLQEDVPEEVLAALRPFLKSLPFVPAQSRPGVDMLRS
jgi:haloacetate dehalogenase